MILDVGEIADEDPRKHNLIVAFLHQDRFETGPVRVMIKNSQAIDAHKYERSEERQNQRSGYQECPWQIRVGSWTPLLQRGLDAASAEKAS